MGYLTKITMLKKHDQSIIWLITNIDTINITTFTGPEPIELDINRQQIIFLTETLGLKSMRRESQPLLQSDIPTVVIYRNPFKFKHLSPSMRGFAQLVEALPFHSACRGIDIEKRNQFLQAEYCFKNRTLEFPVTLLQISDEYEQLEKVILRHIELPSSIRTTFLTNTMKHQSKFWKTSFLKPRDT